MYIPHAWPGLGAERGACEVSMYPPLGAAIQKYKAVLPCVSQNDF